MWQETKDGLYKKFQFADFKQAFQFMDQVAVAAEDMQHHPRWENEWSTVQIWLKTHHEGGLITDKDWQLSKEIDAIYNRGIGKKNVDEKSTKKVTSAGPKLTEIKMFADGGSRGNPGPSASGFVLLNMDDSIIEQDGLYLGITTNNQAEYQAVKLGLEAARKRGAREINVYLDSLLVVNQMKGIFKIRNRDLWPIHQAIRELMTHFKRVTFTHVPREFNKLADAMVNETLDSVQNRNSS